jgi:hypothetical protein
MESSSSLNSRHMILTMKRYSILTPMVFKWRKESSIIDPTITSPKHGLMSYIQLTTKTSLVITTQLIQPSLLEMRKAKGSSLS